MNLPGPNCLVSQVCYVSPLGNHLRLFTSLADVNHPGSQEDMVSNWEPADSLVEDTVSGAEIAVVPCLVALDVEHLPLSLWGGRALYDIWLTLLWYSLNPSVYFQKSFCLFVCFVLFCLSGIPWFGLLSHISSLRLSSGIQSKPLL